MFGIKSYFLKKINLKFNKVVNLNQISENGLSYIDKKLTEIAIFRQLTDENWDKQIQTPVSAYTNPESRKIAKIISKFNPNNLGNWSEEKVFHLSGLLEKKIIEYSIKLIKTNKKEIGGYLTTGGTEANIFAMWLGRNLLKKSIKTKQILVLKTSLTHYSIEKAIDLVGLNYIDISINSKNWGMSIKDLEGTIKREYKKGQRGFLIPLTLGYTITGSDDPIKEINDLINKLKKQYKQIKFFCWVDAAFSGIIKPFTEEEFSPFSNNNIQAFLTDFHKVMAVPYNSGVILYRKKLIKNIENEVAYIGKKDRTLLGSRSGNSAIITWFTIVSLGQKKIKKIIDKSLEDKKNFIKKIQKKIPDIQIINQKNNIQIGLITNRKNQKKILNKMNLEEIKQKIVVNGKNKKISIYKIYFLPFFKN